MAVVDTLITEYKMNSRDYVQGANDATDATNRMGGAVSMGIDVVTKFALAVGAVAGAYVSFGVYASGKAAEFDALVKALESVVGGAGDAKKALEELQAIAALPGLGLQEAIEGYTSLRRAGVGDELAMRTLRGAGNANALASGGREELAQILRAIAQIAMKPNLSGEELMQLNEAGVGASKIIGDKFGTFDGAELKKLGVTSKEALEALVEGLEDMPKAQESAKNAIENLQMAAEMAVIGIGTGLNNGLIGSVTELSTALDNLNKGGLWELLGEKLATITQTAFPELGTSAETLEDMFVDLAVVVANVNQALGNMKMNGEDMFGWIWDLGEIPRKILTWGMDPEAGWENVKPAGDQVRDEYEQANFLPTEGIPPEVLARRRARQTLEAEEGKPSDSTKPKTDAEKEQAELLKRTADYALEQSKMLSRVAVASEKLVEIELNKSIIGGSAYGEGALSAVNMSGGPPSTMGGFGNVLAGVIDSRIATMLREANKQR